MGLTLVTGRANAGKSGRAVDHVVAAAAAGRPAALVLPSHADALRAREELAGRIAVGVEVTDAGGWIADAWTKRGDGRALLTAAVRAQTARAAAEAAVPLVGEVARSRGFSRALQRVAQRTAGRSLVPARSEGSAAIAVALGDYSRRLREAGFVEPGEAVERLGETGWGSGATLAFHRFTDIANYQERAVLHAARLNDVLVAVTWENGFAAGEANDALVQRLLSAGAVHDHVPTPATAEELGLLEAQMFAPSAPIDASGAVRLVVGSGLEAECAAAADEAAEAAQTWTPGRVAVCFRDLAGRRGMIEAALRSRGVPHEIDVATPWRQTALGRSMAALLRLALGDGTRAEAHAFAVSVLSGVNAEQARALDVEWRRRRVDQPRLLLAGLAAIGGETQRAVALADASAVEIGDSWKELALHLYTVAVRQSGRRSKVELRLDRSAAQSVIDAVQAVTASAEVASPRDLLHALAELEVNTGSGEREDAVLVTEAHRVRSRRFDALIIGGLTAGEFPADPGESFARSTESELLGSPIDPDGSERFLFYVLATRARERLVLMRQTEDADGKPVRPSVFWDEVLDLYRTPEQARDGEAGGLKPYRAVDPTMLTTVPPMFTPDRSGVRERAARGVIDPPRPGRGAAPLEALVADREEWRVTEIEAYHSCPYRWFFDTRLRLREIDVAFGPREAGTLAHEVVARFYEQWLERYGSRVTPDRLSDAIEMMESTGRQLAERVMVRGVSEQAAVDRALAWARHSVDVDAELYCGFDPAAFEYRFGGGAERNLEFGGARLRGSIDRVDIGPAGLIVTDYKSSDVKAHDNFESAGLLQVVVYAVAARQAMELPIAGAFYRSFKTAEVRGFNSGVVPVSVQMKAGDVGAQEVWAELVTWAESVVRDSVAGMRAGNVAPAPRTKDACRYCGARDFCKERLS